MANFCTLHTVTGGVTVFFNTRYGSFSEDSFSDGVVMEYTGEKGLCTVGMERGNKRAASRRLKVEDPGGIASGLHQERGHFLFVYNTRRLPAGSVTFLVDNSGEVLC